MDQITEQRVATLHPAIRVDLKAGISIIEGLGLEMRITQAFRSFAEQDALYYQDKLPILEVNKLRFAAHLPLFPDNGQKLPWASNAKGGQSYHNYGLAFDFCIKHKDGSVSFDFKEDSNQDQKSDFLQVIDIFKNLKFVSGMTFPHPDNDHLEKTFGYNFSELDLLLKQKRVDSNGYVII